MNRLHLNAVSSVFKINMIYRAFCTLLFLVCLSLSATLQAAELTAEVDRTTVIDGEAVVLYLTGTDIQQLPDTSALNKDFRIIQSGQSSSQTIVNGNRSQKVTVRFELQPNRLGPTIIPAFTVNGVSSKPITIEVVARGTPGVEPRDKIFAELSVDDSNPYVQEQVILSLKIFDDGTLVGADPDVSGNNDYQIEPLPLAAEQIVERSGVQYRVNTFRYALFPQQSGTIDIDEITIPASVRDNSRSGNRLLFNTPTRRIELKSDSASLSVKPRAAASTSGWWLPVRSLELKHQWSGDISAAKVGEPLTLTFEMIANGSTSTQLPEITVPDVPGVKIYVDNPEFGSQATGVSLLSVRRERWSVIPNQSGPNQDGQLLLPEIVVKWWDTAADVERRAVIPAQQLVVEGAAVDQSAIVSNATAVNADAVQGPLSEPEAVATEDAVSAESPQLADSAEVSDNLSSERFVSRHWLYLAVIAVTAWLATLLAWWWSALKRKASKPSTEKPRDNSAERKAFKKMQSLSGTEDTQAYSEAVLEWSQHHWPQNPVHNLPDIGVRLSQNDSAGELANQLTSNMRLLDQQRFSSQQNNGLSVPLVDIQQSLEAALAQKAPDKRVKNTHVLPEL